MAKLPPYTEGNPEIKQVVIAHMTGHANDPTIAILRAHLLIEQFLNDFIRQNLSHPEYLDGAKLSFAQKQKLTESIHSGFVTQDKTMKELWSFVSQLNGVRNLLAHQGFGDMDQTRLKAFENALRASLPPVVSSPERDAAAAASGERVYTELEVLLTALCARVAIVLAADIHYKPKYHQIAQKLVTRSRNEDQSAPGE
jgi:hypothetical protein